MTRVAAIDCGTNSIRLLVADVPPTGAHTDLLRRMEVVRLGQGVDATGRLAPEAIERTRRGAGEYADQARDLGATARPDGRHQRHPRRGQPADFEDMVSADPRPAARRRSPASEEAELSFLGATASLDAAAAAHGTAPPPPPFLVVDIGGGSTEFVLGDAAGVRAARSVDIGCVRLTERHLHGDPPTAEQIAPAPRTTSGPRWPRSAPRCRSGRPPPWSAWPARSPRSRRSPWTCRPTTPTPSTARGSRWTTSAR